MALITSDSLKIVIGLGKTGLSCARYLAAQGKRFALVDTRADLAVDAVREEFPGVEIRLGPLSGEFLVQADCLYLSPGVPQSEPAIVQAVAQGVTLSGDIDLFCQAVKAPIIAITGSNAKSTVTTWVGEMAEACGVNVGVGGNLGTPVLDMLHEGEKDLYVLELSSFQLETTHDLRAKVATVLNISPDHQDRYSDMAAYHRAKHRIFRGCKAAVENRDDPLTHPLLPAGVPLWGYRLGKSDRHLFGLIEEQGQEWLALGNEKLMPINEIKLPGRHNVANALAALALGHLAGLSMPGMLASVRSFGGLEHRCQWVADKKGVRYFNDSKGTNVGATVAALEGLGKDLTPDHKIILIAGGDGKGAAFTELAEPLARYARSVVLIGKDAARIEAALPATTPRATLPTLELAVEKAADDAKEGDIVLLSPACASLDMFKNYNERGACFIASVERL